MWVVKLGGSLADSRYLQSWLNALAEHGPGRIVIVPGGGPFADAVRLAQTRQPFPDDCAHAMALLAMHQYALMLHGLCPKLVLENDIAKLAARLAAQECVIWLPDITQLDAAAIPASWDVTSDSLSAWLAGRISASDLLLVKSAIIPNDASWDKLQSSGIVDAAFAGYVQASHYRVHWLGPKNSAQLASVIDSCFHIDGFSVKRE